MKDRILKFKRAFMDGPTYICQCCKRCLFRDGVKILNPRDISKLAATCKASFLAKIFNGLNLSHRKNLNVCHNCFTTISVHKRMPRIAEANGLQLDEIPEELIITDVEEQLIAKTLVFMKIKYLPKRMVKAMLNRVVNVPLNDEDINKTISKLPRLPDEAKVIAIELKRKIELKSVHAGAYVNPSHIRKALQKLKQLENPFYQNISIDEEALRQLEEEPMEVDEVPRDRVEEEVEVENITEDKIRESSTSLIPRNGMAADMYVNDGNGPVDVNNILKLAPGEGICNAFRYLSNLVLRINF